MYVYMHKHDKVSHVQYKLRFETADDTKFWHFTAVDTINMKAVDTTLKYKHIVPIDAHMSGPTSHYIIR